ERQLKTHQLRSIFYHLPPLPNLFSAMTRLLWFGFILYSAGMISGFFVNEPLPWTKIVLAIAIWLLYGAILQGRYLRWIARRRIELEERFGSILSQGKCGMRTAPFSRRGRT